MRRCIILIGDIDFCRLTSCCRCNYFFRKLHTPLLIGIIGIGICSGHIISADKLIDRLCTQWRLLHHIRWPAAASYWEWRRREVCCVLNFVCLPGFRVGLFVAGSSVVLFALTVLTPVCQFHPLAASLCCCRYSREHIIQ